MHEHNRAVGRALALERKEASDLPAVLAEVSGGLGEAMVGISTQSLPPEQRLETRGW